MCTIDEICCVAMAEAFRGDGEILCNPIGTVPIIGGRLARATFEPDLMMTDTVAALVANTIPVGVPPGEKVIETYSPYRTIFDIVWSGKRHVVMGASQVDMWGNQNLAAIGDWRKPKAQLLGLRGAPGNAINHTMSYWIPNHSKQVFVDKVDVVSAPGYDRMRGARRAGVALARDPPRRVQPRRVRFQDARQPHAARVGASGRHGRPDRREHDVRVGDRRRRSPRRDSRPPTSCG